MVEKQSGEVANFLGAIMVVRFFLVVSLIFVIKRYVETIYHTLYFAVKWVCRDEIKLLWKWQGAC
jgi:hypothetical protein